MKKHTGFILLSAAFGLLSANAAVDCLALSVSVKNAAASDRSNVLDLVSREVGASPDCACEIVKAAIEGSAANAKTVAAIVQAAATAAPEHMRLIAQCAVAVAPDSRAAVQAVIALLATEGEVASMPNPLDFPGQGPVGPTPGGPGGMPLIPFLPPINVVPPVVVPPVVVPPVVVPPVVVPPVIPNPPPFSPGNFPPGPPPGAPGGGNELPPG